MKQVSFFLLFAIFMILPSCVHQLKIGEAGMDSGSSGHGIYYWKTTFRLNEADSTFLKKNEIDRMYLRMFDVDVERNYIADDWDVVPVGTVKFESKVPAELEIVPTVFITVQALNVYDGREEELARLILKRMMAMCSYNDIGSVSEFQFDCDWTESSRTAYERLCEAAKGILHSKGISLSGTIRLHQVEEAVYPFDRGVLMLYNTGAIKDPQTKNSIISFDDVYNYLSVKSRVGRFRKARNSNCSIIDFAYPTFCWGVCYEKDGRFDGIIRSLEFDNQQWLERKGNRYFVKSSGVYESRWYDEGQYVRPEYSDIDEILKVKELVDRTIGRNGSSNIIFHLDQNNLSKYNQNDISKILR